MADGGAAPATGNNHDGRYAVDVRIFIAIISLTMAASFMVGVTMAPANNARPPSPPLSTENNPGSPTAVRDNFLNVSHDDSETIEGGNRPSGHHLLVDIMGVEGDFLDSEERLSKALVDTVREAG